MAMSLNKVQLIGNLTRDPEMRQIPGGQVVASFGIATNLTWTDKDGQKQSKVEFHNIVAWRRLAEICGQYLKKGGKVYIEGRLQTRDWEGEDGTKRYRTEIVAENMIMLDRKGDMAGGSAGGFSAGRASAGLAPVPSEGPVDDDFGDKASAEKSADGEAEVKVDDLPF